MNAQREHTTSSERTARGLTRSRGRVRPHVQRRHQQGAALLLAMLTAALVAAIAATASWRIWQISEVESAEQDRAQMQWVLQGALDWARLLLREDARANQRDKVDHLNEPWALPLQEARLSTFLAAKDQASAQAEINDAFLSGRVIDAQSRFNLTNLWDQQGQVSTADLATLLRLCELTQNPCEPWLQAMQQFTPQATENTRRPVPAQRLQDWMRAGLPAPLMARMSPVLTVLPTRTAINLNTAPAVVLAAAVPNASLADAAQWVRERNLQPFRSLNDWQTRHPEFGNAVGSGLATWSDYFEVTGQLRIGRHTVTETSLLHRDNLRVQVMWRKGANATMAQQPIAQPAP